MTRSTPKRRASAAASGNNDDDGDANKIEDIEIVVNHNNNEKDDNNNNDAVSVTGSVASRSSLRLKRKRDTVGNTNNNNYTTTAAAAAAEPTPTTPSQSKKRRKVAPATNQKKTTATRNAVPEPNQDDDDDDDEMKEPDDTTTNTHNEAKLFPASIEISNTNTNTNGQQSQPPHPEQPQPPHPELRFSTVEATGVTASSWTTSSSGVAVGRDTHAATTTATASLDPLLSSSSSNRVAPPPQFVQSPPPPNHHQAGGGGRWNLDASTTAPTPFKLSISSTKNHDDDDTNHTNNRDENEPQQQQQQQQQESNDNNQSFLLLAEEATPADGAAEESLWQRWSVWAEAWMQPIPPNPTAAAAAAAANRLDAIHGVSEPAAITTSTTTTIPPPLHRTRVWFWILLGLQIVFYPLWLNPILSSTVALSKALGRLYRGRRPASSSDEHDSGVRQMATTLERLARELQDLQREESALTQQYVAWQNTARSAQRQHAQSKVFQLAAVVDQLELLLSLQDERLMGSPLVTTVAQILWKQEQLDAEAQDSDNEQSAQRGSRPPPLLDFTPLELWSIEHVEDASCIAGNNNEDIDVNGTTVPAVSLSIMEETRSELQNQAENEAFAMTKKADSVATAQHWIRTSIQSELEAFRQVESSNTFADADMTVENEEYLTLEQVRRIIVHYLTVRGSKSNNILEDRMDYASLWNGAAILSWSPSLIDRLPVLNRIAASMGLRFYGHGPAAALTPTTTVISSSLGQCWSFAKQKQNFHATRDSYKNVPFGYLTIRLAQPIAVESVVIEHPFVTDPSASAIRGFRVIGFEQEDHQQMRTASSVDDKEGIWLLGSFEYMIVQDPRSKQMRQEFQVPDLVEGKRVPLLQFLRLEIDSNWGAEYTCLYRFRVHGHPGANKTM